jgi:hypothetical protein
VEEAKKKAKQVADFERKQNRVLLVADLWKKTNGRPHWQHADLWKKAKWKA